MDWNLLGGVGLGIQKGAEELRKTKDSQRDDQRFAMEQDRYNREVEAENAKMAERTKMKEYLQSGMADLQAADADDDEVQKTLRGKYIGAYNDNVPDGYQAFDLGNGKISIRKSDDFSEVGFREFNGPALKKAIMADMYYKMGMVTPEGYAQVFQTMLQEDDKAFGRRLQQMQMQLEEDKFGYAKGKDTRDFDQSVLQFERTAGQKDKALALQGQQVGIAAANAREARTRKGLIKPTYKTGKDGIGYAIVGDRAVPIMTADGKPLELVNDYGKIGLNNEFKALQEFMKNNPDLPIEDAQQLMNMSVYDAFDAGSE